MHIFKGIRKTLTINLLARDLNDSFFFFSSLSFKLWCSVKTDKIKAESGIGLIYFSWTCHPSVDKAGTESEWMSPEAQGVVQLSPCCNVSSCPEECAWQRPEKDARAYSAIFSHG